MTTGQTQIPTLYRTMYGGGFGSRGSEVRTSINQDNKGVDDAYTNNETINISTIQEYEEENTNNLGQLGRLNHKQSDKAKNNPYSETTADRYSQPE